MSIDIESGNTVQTNNDDIVSTTTTKSSSNTWPTWITNLHLFFITTCFLSGIGVSIWFALIPYLKHKPCPTQTCKNQARTGFRTFLIIFHAVIDLIIFCTPYFVCYKSYFKNQLHLSMDSTEIAALSEKLPMDRLSQNASDKSIAEKKFYYSYSINDGPGHQIATLGVSISNICFALIIYMRFQSLLPHQYTLITGIKSSDIRINYKATKIAFFLGLFTRVFASGVPTFPVKKFPKTHYVFTGLMFFVFGFYMLTEVFFVDPTLDIKGINYCIVARRACCIAYWFSFVGIMIFGKLNLSALSSICELLALLLQEIYIVSYISTFRQCDGVSPLLTV
eukprot:147920_1